MQTVTARCECEATERVPGFKHQHYPCDKDGKCDAYKNPDAPLKVYQVE